MAPVIEGEHAEVLAERGEAAEEVDVGGGGPAVQQHERGGARRAGLLAAAGCGRPERDRSPVGERRGLDRGGQAVSTFNTWTR